MGRNKSFTALASRAGSFRDGDPEHRAEREDEAVRARSLAPLPSGGSLPYLRPSRRALPRGRSSRSRTRSRSRESGESGAWSEPCWKLIRIPREKGDLFELYDLVDDPRETKNLFPEFEGAAAKLQPLLEKLGCQSVVLDFFTGDVEATRNSEPYFRILRVLAEQILDLRLEQCGRAEARFRFTEKIRE